MPFLRRSKSHKTKQHPDPATPPPPPQHPRRDTQPKPHHPQPPPTAAPEDNVAEPTWKQERRASRFERRGSIFGRSKSASDARSAGVSMERPRTAGAGGDALPPPPPPPTTMTTKAAAPQPQPQSLMTRPADAVGGRSRDLPSHLSVIGETIEIKAGGDTFSFPTPSPRLPSSTTQQVKGPSTTALQQASSSASQSEEPLRLPPTPGIGRAIGSPSQAPPTWGRSYTADEMNGRAMMGRMTAKTGHEQHGMQEDTAGAEETSTLPPIPSLRRKESRWKTLGALFARSKTPTRSSPAAAAAAVTEPFYRVQLPPPPPHSPSPYALFRPSLDMPSSASPVGMVRSPGSISTHHSRTPSVNRGLARAEARAEADRLSFWGFGGLGGGGGGHGKRGSVGTPLSDGTRTSADLFGTAQREEPRPDARTTAGIREVDGGAVPRMPRLDLDIPGAEMERYSVMFEKLLEPRQSILERRQSKAKRQRSVVGGKVARKDLPAVPLAAAEEICGPSPIEVQQVAAAMMGPVQNRSLPQRSLTSPHLKRVPSLTVTLGSKTGAASLRPPSSSQEQTAGTALHRPRPIRRSKTAPTGSVSPVAPNFSRPKFLNAATSTEDLRANTPESPLLGEESLPPTPTNIMALPHELHPPHEPLSVAKRRAAASRRNDSVDEQSWDMLTSPPTGTPKASPRFPHPQQQQRPGEHQQQQAPYPLIKSPAALERQIVQVSVARQVSVSKARKLVQRAQVESRLPLRPRVVEMRGRGERKSTHVVLIEGGED
ncbi:hypothetical protein LTR33_014353 [Friedmanniomyces endolithicus]|nr:hypothetical protein LTR33_014353 [Friedmanniomyces endolithicus]